MIQSILQAALVFTALMMICDNTCPGDELADGWRLTETKNEFNCLATCAQGDKDEEQRQGRPLVVAHRGLLLDAPENTLANFRVCLELQLGFELDVRRSKDGYLVCVHDETVDRTTNGKGKVRDLTLRQLKALDAGSWFDGEFRGERVPTLDEVFLLLAKHKNTKVLIAVDLKGDDPKIEADLVSLANRHKVLDRLLMIGRTINNVDVRQRLLAADGAAHVACLANKSEEFAQAVADKHSDWVYVRYVPKASEVEQSRKAGKRIFIAGSTVSGLETDNWRTAAKRGVTAILTDYSIELSRQLRANQRVD